MVKLKIAKTTKNDQHSNFRKSSEPILKDIKSKAPDLIKETRDIAAEALLQAR